MAFWDYFDGTTFYSLRNKYRSQLLESAKAVIAEYDLQCFIYDTSGTYTLTDDEYAELQADYDSYEAELKERFQPTEGTFSINGRVVSWTRYGVETYTKIYGEQMARKETEYVMDLIEPTQVAIWVAGFAAASLLIPLLWIPGTQAAYAAAVAALVGAISAAIANVVYGILSLVMEASQISITAALASATAVGTYLSAANEYMQTRELSPVGLKIYEEYKIYAGGSLYNAQKAGDNNSYTPTKPYNPSERFAPIAFIPDKFKTASDYTQGRNHYTLAGNEGFLKQLAPSLKLSKVEKIDDLEFKLNNYKTFYEKLLRGYSELAKYISSDETYDCQDWLQSWIDYENDGAKDVYYSYLAAYDTIDRSQNYNKALRTDITPIDISELRRQEEQDNITIEVEKDTQYTPPSEEDFEMDEEVDYEELLDLYLQSKIAETQDEYQWYDTESKEFLEFKLAFFEALDINYFINSNVLNGIVSGMLSDEEALSDSEFLDYYTNYLTDNYLAYLLAVVSGLTLEFDTSVCKDALGYYFGLFASEYDSDVALGLDNETFLNEPYDSHSKVDLGSYSFELEIESYNGENGESYAFYSDAIENWGDDESTIGRTSYWTNLYLLTSVSGTTASFVGFTLSAELIEKYFDGSDTITISAEDLGLEDVYIARYWYQNYGSLTTSEIYVAQTKLKSITFSLKSKTEIDHISENSFSDFTYYVNSGTYNQTIAGWNETIWYIQTIFSGSTSKANVTWSINSYYDSADIYTKASSWLEAKIASLKESLETAKTQEEIQAEYEASLE